MTLTLDPARYSNIVVLTGAGVSVASGLRTYRGPGGVWDEFKIEEVGTGAALRRDPARTWRHYGARREALRGAEPNAAHLALARFEAGLGADGEGRRFLLVTQNVDGLHGRAGSRNVVELHGNLGRTRCANDACDLEAFADHAAHGDEVPRCPRCGTFLRPDIVLFGEPLSPDDIARTELALRDCDLFLAVGTSGLVMPAAACVEWAALAGARTVYVNLEPMEPRNPAFQEEVLGRAEEILPRLLGAEG